MVERISSLNWIAENLRIINKAGFLVPLEPNVGQYMLHSVMARQRAAGFPVRILLLKPRQVGWSTWTEAEAFFEINTIANRTALCTSADIDSTDMVFNMTKTFQNELPENLRRKTTASSRKEIVYSAPHRSKFITQTAGKDVLGRGGTIHFFHASEVAFWPKDKEGLAAVLQMIPNSIDTTVVLESTANGVGGAFYDMYQQALERLKGGAGIEGYLPVFFPWFKFSEYKTMVHKGFKLYEDEEQLKQEYTLTDEQLFWRRLKIQELGGDESLFKQEYPSTSTEAFQTTGNPVFTKKMLDDQRNKCTKDPRTCVFVGEKIEDVNRSLNCWKVAKLPKEGHQYCIGIDTMENRLSDVNDPKSLLDYDGAVILDRTSMEAVAIWHGRSDQKELGEQCLWAAKMYNTAWVAPEIPNGMTLLSLFKEDGYENIYNRQVHDEQLVIDDSENLGWRTTLVTRKWLVDNFLVILRDNAIRVMFSDIVDEMNTFIRDKTGKPIHSPSKHDDLLFGLMIAIQIHLRCPLNLIPYKDDSTGMVTAQNVDENEQFSLSGIGVIDYGIRDDMVEGEWEETN